MKKGVRQAVRAEFTRACAEGRAPDFAAATQADWIKVADDLILRGDLELGAYAVRSIRATWPSLAWGNNVAELLDLMPPADADAARFADDFSKTLQVAPRPGADTVVLVFCGAENRVGMPVPMLHRWLSRSPVSLVYLRDPSGRAYLGGLAEAGPDLAATLARLRAVFQELGARRVVCYGNSIGGYGALRYGLELEADAVFCMAGLVNMRSDFNAGLHYLGAARRIEAAFPKAELDLRERYLAAAAPPATWMVHAEHNWDDRIHAEHMAGLEGVTLTRIAGSKNHNVAAELIRAGRFEAMLGRGLAA
ncbi:MAG TPA: hypothetical protein VIJ94_19035 [Caulobacteraceae bacterium]